MNFDKCVGSMPNNKIVNAINEANEIVKIDEGLGHVKDKKLLDRIISSVKGHELYVSDNSDRSGKDFAFELFIAAKFALQNYIIEFNHKANLYVKSYNMDLFVECKRLKSEKQIKKNIKKGLKQLRVRYRAGGNPEFSRGILVLSIAKLYNKNLGVFIIFNSLGAIKPDNEPKITYSTFSEITMNNAVCSI